MWMDRLENFSRNINRNVSIYISGVLCLVIMAMMVADAVLRTFFNIALGGLISLSEIMMVWITLAPLGYALVKGVHVRVTIVLDLLPLRLHKFCEFLTYFVGFAAFAFITYFGWLYFWRAWLVKETAMGGIHSPVWIAKPAIPFAAALFSFECLLRLIRIFSPRSKSERTGGN